MTSDQLLDTMLTSTYAKADVLRRLRVIREYLEQRFFTPGGKKPLREFIAGQSLEEGEKKLILDWGDDFFASFTKENAYDYLEEITEKVKKLPTVNMYVPIDLVPDQTDRVGKWVRANIDRNALIEFHVDVSVFGGCAFAWNGVYYDYSLTHYMHTKTDAIRKVLDGFSGKLQHTTTN